MNHTLHPTILLVDDEMDILILLKAKLSKAGYTVETSFNGEHFLDSVHQHRPDLILMDITMNGLDGGSLCHLLKSSDWTQQIPIVLFSGNDNIQAIAKTCHADAVLPKPYDPQAFENVLHKLLG
ncbi:response regulator [Terrimonas sp. NA20]|uniref:Response regulator n=1 Tax=Terrimonas ginsenosidimutans TaxID=2908004 RepID=A0ABS9KRZ1_9BACT|nr:response regulator [Terrimonas ginsenosidimutans]MCG2615097.1 response regulator [Terrimonas ginsenosidimutans]